MSDDEIKALRADAEMLGLLPKHDARNAVVFYLIASLLSLLGVMVLVWSYI